MSRPDERRRQTLRNRVMKILQYVPVCAYCRLPGNLDHGPDGKPWVIDHVWPLAKGGVDEPSNMVKACWSCNNRKRADIWPLPIGTPLGNGRIHGEHHCKEQYTRRQCTDWCLNDECKAFRIRTGKNNPWVYYDEDHGFDVLESRLDHE